MAEELRLGLNDWEHVDLFLNRTPNQEELKVQLFPTGEPAEPSECGIAQLELTVPAILKAQPRVIIVGNAFPSDVLVKYQKCRSQRTVQKYNWQRLKWHVGKAWAATGPVVSTE